MPKDFNDIIPPSRRRTLVPDAEPQMPSMESDIPVVSPPPSWNNRPARPIKTGRRFPIGTAIIALVVIAASAGALYAFSGAKVTVTPATNTANVSGDFTATAGTGDLPYAIVQVDKVGSQTVPAESTQTVNQAAQGTIVVSNQQPVAQTLITNTRFATPDGLVFRIHGPITVPAAKNGVAGTVNTTVYADQTGEKYNVGPTTFTLPGLSGGKSFTLVTAKSSDAMVGGFSGTRPTVSQSTHDAQINTIQTALATDLQTALKAKMQAGYVLLPGASFTTYTPQPDTATSDGKVNVNVKGSVVAVVFPADALAKAVTYKVVGTYAGQPVSIPDVSTLTLTPATPTPPSGQDDFTFSLAGNATIVWTVDPSKIAAAVAGKTRDAAQVVLSGFPEVDKATLVLRPFWTSTFPSDPTRITVTVLDTASKAH